MTTIKLDDPLLIAAAEARSRAYAPYSKFAVGAAVEVDSGRIFTGVNVENASYGLTVCAERIAIFAAVAAGETNFRRLAVVADTVRPTAPCGACRQVMREFNVPIVTMGNVSGDRIERTLQELLPESFGPEDLKGEHCDPT